MNDLIDDLAADLAMRFIQSLYGKSRECYCSECRPKPPPQPVIPDCADLVDEVLRNAGVKRPMPTPMKYPRNYVIIFAGDYAGRFGILHQEQYCSCHFYVKTIFGVVKVDKEHCIINA